MATPALGIEAAPIALDAAYATLHGLYWLTVNLAQRQPDTPSGRSPKPGS